MAKKTKQTGFRPGLILPPYHNEVSIGNVPGRTPVWRYGHNLAVAATEETIWGASVIYPYLAAAEKLKISSSVPATDIPASTGAWTVMVEGMSSAYKMISETVTLLNPGPVTTTLRYLRLFCIRVMTVGTGGKNAGIISAKDFANTVTLGYMLAGENQCHAAIWTVPVGHRFVMLEWQGGEVAAKESHILLYIRRYGEPFQLKNEIIVKDSGFYLPLLMPGNLPEKTDLEMRCTATGGSGVIYGAFSGYYEKMAL